MKISLNWLKSYINFPLSASEIASLLTQRGLEVAHIHSAIKGNLEGVVIGDVLSCQNHPNADKLKQTMVDIGLDRPLSIICGATNVAVGQKVVVAPIGSTIYNYVDRSPFQIKKVKIRGEVSEGMICAEDEIGLGPMHDSIIVLDTDLPAGTPAKTHFKDVLDEILEIDITPNRVDACSHLGIARELKAILHLPSNIPSVDDFDLVSFFSPFIHINNVDAILAPRYSGVVLKNVVVQPSPIWLKSKLEHIGLKSINNVVDVTNFVLHELGQPLHAFDYNTIVGKELMVQQLSSGTLFLGLDGIERKLSGHEPMICDMEGPIAMAGILGGLRTSITSTTQDIFIESAYFSPAAIRSTAQYHSLKTDASFRFERGADPNMTVYALKRAALLLKIMIPSIEISEIIDHYPTRLTPCAIPFSYETVKRHLGVDMSPAIIQQIITDLEIEIEAPSEEGFIAKVPLYRVDVTREVDLIEEIARIYGYDALPTTGHLSTGYLAPETNIGSMYRIEQEISKMLVANGYYEIWTNSLTKKAYADILNIEELCNKEIAILNPLSASTNILRYTLLFSGLEVVAYNLARRQFDIKLFEFGTVYTQNGTTYNEEKRLSIWLTGEIESKNWVRKLGTVTLSTLRATIDQLTKKLGITALSYKETTHPFYEQAAQVTHKGIVIMTFGQVNHLIVDHFGITQPVFFADISWKHILQISKLNTLYKPISKFPAVKRDLSLVVDKSVLFQDIKDLIMQQGHKNLQEIALFDVYEGAHLPAGKKAYAINFTLQDHVKTMDDKSIDKIMNQLMQTFEHDLNAIIRR
ncbi:phenylalanine--tRNA ligase subunit beta [Cardinium endosymbiont of Culicoides punctatus]|uniref:phenylalanine--tRNA ligase subunit beta n=1 Tax=Cardinium endosymbiont of Culicoides punctatus TaxID=2304601 RepID=UPI001058F0AA|nr:phenylalanine--tRNA ligase subunit beta [Cardinium endosymbiont of Culicoides punctatus]TDG95710.1 Phenylalanine--tRNA ligase beta subunit [Cardinium endosymbiont of Culicoides punctatus]